MIEQAMIFALGFLVAGLIALACAPAFWRRALRLTRRRLEAQVPLSVEEILADRDHLRAEFAVERRRLEIHTAEIAKAHAADRSELGRRAAEITALQQAIAGKDDQIRANSEALAKAEQEIVTLSGESGALNAALYEADGLYKTKQEQFAELSQENLSLSTLADERLAGHTSADARAAGLELRLGDLSRTLLEAEKRFTERTAHAARLNDALVVARNDFASLEGNHASLQKNFDAQIAHAAQLAKDVEELKQLRDADQGKLRALNAKTGMLETALEEVKKREAQVLAQQDQKIEKLRAEKRASREKYDDLRSEFAAAQGALDAARRRCETLEAELAQLRAAPAKHPSGSEADKNVSLRQDGSEIGAAPVQLAQNRSDAPPSLSPSGEAPHDEEAAPGTAESLEMTNHGSA